MEKISFVIPCYRSEHTVGAVVNEIVEKKIENPESIIKNVLNLGEEDEQDHS